MLHDDDDQGKQESQTSWKCGCEEGNSENPWQRLPPGRSLSNSSLGSQGSHGLSSDEERTEAAQEQRQPRRMDAPSAPLLARAHLTSVRLYANLYTTAGLSDASYRNGKGVSSFSKMKVNAKKDLPLDKVSPSKCFQTENDFKMARAT